MEYVRSLKKTNKVFLIIVICHRPSLICWALFRNLKNRKRLACFVLLWNRLMQCDWNSNICYDGNSILLQKRRFYLRSEEWQATVKKRVAAYAVLRTSEFQEIKQTVNIAKYQNTKQISGDIKYNRNIKRWKNSLELCNFTVLGKTDLPALPSSLDLCQQQSYNTSLVTWLKLL